MAIRTPYCRRCKSRLEFWLSVQSEFCSDCRCQVPGCNQSAAGEYGNKRLCMDHVLDSVEVMKYDQFTSGSAAARTMHRTMLYQAWAEQARIRAANGVVCRMNKLDPPPMD